VFIVELLFWYVTLSSIVTLSCSALFVIYFCTRMIFEMLFVVPPPGQPGHSSTMRAFPEPRPPATITQRSLAAVDKRISAFRRRRDTSRAVAAAGPWGPIDRALSPEIAHKIERVMAIGVAMYDAGGKPRPHPIAPRVALAIVEALQRGEGGA
jgi:hypothetical protein